MLRPLLPALVAGGALCAAFAPPPTAAPALPSPPAVHCQVPCGIYGDRMRIDMLMEDAVTIEKAMTTLRAMAGEEHPDHNQMVRWVVNKEQHAQAIQDTLAAYWLAQRIKAPKDAGDAAATAAYHDRLAHLHRLTVAAMKCKQTTDGAYVAALRETALSFSALYFSAEDLEHIRSHHGAEHR
ncbi:MAG: superoxide dismutase [Ni] [Planctomycetota bacterium]|nr:superoxide dismutase [Ni] [Planctomycetota bacterium]